MKSQVRILSPRLLRRINRQGIGREAPNALSIYCWNMTSGYSKRTLAEKLGIKAGTSIFILNAPETYWRTLSDLPTNVLRPDAPSGPFDLVHFFTKSRRELEERFPVLKLELAANGML